MILCMHNISIISIIWYVLSADLDVACEFLGTGPWGGLVMCKELRPRPEACCLFQFISCFKLSWFQMFRHADSLSEKAWAKFAAAEALRRPSQARVGGPATRMVCNANRLRGVTAKIKVWVWSSLPDLFTRTRMSSRHSQRIPGPGVGRTPAAVAAAKLFMF